jgi:Anti-sigma-K factor rskA
MSEQRRITSEDLALFAMQLLSKEETAEVAAYVAQSADARRELAEIQGDLAIYAHSVDLHTPPAQARERLMKQVAREKAIPIDREAAQETSAGRSGSTFADAVERANSTAKDNAANESPQNGRSLGSDTYLTEDDQPKRGAGKILPWIGWAIAAGLAVATGDLYHERESLHDAMTTQASQIDQLKTDAAAKVADAAAGAADAAKARKVLDTLTDSSAMRITLSTYKASTAPLGRVTYVAGKGALIFTVSNLGSLQPTKTYELWLLPSAEGQKPIPAGTFLPDGHGNASVIMPPLPAGVEAKGFGVTIEDEGGSTTPTMPIVLVGE